MTVKASIIVPLYNKEATIGRTIESVLAQSEPDFELIIVNDGSSDNSLRIAEQYTDDRIRLLSQENAGPGAARNLGLEEAHGQYVNFLDADDELCPDFLRLGIQILEDNQECALVNFSWYVFPEGIDNSAHHQRQGISEGRYRLSSKLGPETLKEQLDYMHSGAILARKDLVEQYGGFYAKRRCTLGEDSYLWLQILIKCDIYRLPVAMVKFHREDSDLGFSRKTPYPLVPHLLEHRDYLSKFSKQEQTLVKRIYANYLVLSMYRAYATQSLNTATAVVRLIPSVIITEATAFKNYGITLAKYLQLLLLSPFKKERPQ